ncbi:hypothetical protein L1887_14439 [Cichorium endivia]|nr:hypothetical protein L1887_14439 [Cichorium endivia]
MSASMILILNHLPDAVSRIASLGFEKSYREAVVLMIRSYLSKLFTIGSAESKTLPPETTSIFMIQMRSLVAISLVECQTSLIG